MQLHNKVGARHDGADIATSHSPSLDILPRVYSMKVFAIPLQLSLGDPKLEQGSQHGKDDELCQARLRLKQRHKGDWPAVSAAQNCHGQIPRWM